MIKDVVRFKKKLLVAFMLGGLSGLISQLSLPFTNYDTIALMWIPGLIFGFFLSVHHIPMGMVIHRLVLGLAQINGHMVV